MPLLAKILAANPAMRRLIGGEDFDEEEVERTARAETTVVLTRENASGCHILEQDNWTRSSILGKMRRFSDQKDHGNIKESERIWTRWTPHSA